MTLPPEAVVRFLSRVQRNAPDQCWPWSGPVLRSGRGFMSVRNKNITAPRLALVLAGRPPEDETLFACHSCDNPNCVNPDHLWWGTNSDNMQDMCRKGKHPHRSRTHCIHGHPFGDNPPIRHGARICMKCETRNAAATRARKRAACAALEVERGK